MAAKCQAGVRNRALRQMAIQLTGMLPDETEEVLKVLDYARELVTDYLADPECHSDPLRIVRHSGAVRLSLVRE